MDDSPWRRGGLTPIVLDPGNAYPGALLRHEQYDWGIAWPPGSEPGLGDGNRALASVFSIDDSFGRTL